VRITNVSQDLPESEPMLLMNGKVTGAKVTNLTAPRKLMIGKDLDTIGSREDPEG